MPDVELGDTFLGRLTDTERQVLYNLVEYVSIKKIAENMFIEESTVKTHLKNICTKTGCENKTELLVAALQAKLVLPKSKSN
ncbi:MAG: helix-turn-helix transcriptional regulator [Clostridia bacterium]|nr:helix-turn-helix transcriptional regulator [Clostridia bacterium]